MDYSQILAVDNLDVYARTPDCWKLSALSDLSCNVLQGLYLKLDNQVVDGASVTVWLYAQGGTRSSAVISTQHTFDFGDILYLDYSAAAKRMTEYGDANAVLDIDYVDANNVTHTDKIDIVLRLGIWGVIGNIALPSRFRIVSGYDWYASIANRTGSAATYKRYHAGVVNYTTTVPAQYALGAYIPAGSADVLEFAKTQVPVEEVSCGVVMLTWISKEDGVLKSYAFDVLSEALPQSSIANVETSGMPEWWQTGGAVKRLHLSACDWKTWRYIRDINISDKITMGVLKYDVNGNAGVGQLAVRMTSVVEGVPVNGISDIDFEIETWREEATWAR